jgi:hypothetical protein
LTYIPHRKGIVQTTVCHSSSMAACQISTRWGGERGHHSTYIISSKIHLSIALRYFAGGSVYDIMLVHGVSLVSIYVSMGGLLTQLIAPQNWIFIFRIMSSSRKLPLSFEGRVELGSIMWLVQSMVSWCAHSCLPCLSA